VLRAALRAPQYAYRRGWGRLFGHRFLLLTHRGRRTGRVHHTMLEVLRYDASTEEVTVMSGRGRRADWLQNVLASGEAEVSMGRDRFLVDVRLVPVEEAMGALALYERRNLLLRPILRLSLSLMLGRHVDGSARARRQVAEQLPLVAFRPR